MIETADAQATRADAPSLRSSAPAPHRALRPPARSSIVVLLVSLLASAALSWSSYLVHERNETRLLGLQTKQAATVLQITVPVIQTPLASAAEIAVTSDGNPARFTSYMAAYVGAKGPFVAATLWRMTAGEPTLVASAGGAPALSTARIAAFATRAAKSPVLDVVGLLDRSDPRLGYAYSSVDRPSYVVYAESALPANRRVTVSPDNAFADLRFALYLGHTTRSSALLETNADRLPISGHTSSATITFGSGVLTLVAARSGQLGGALSASLWWIVAIVGAALSVAGALVAERMVRRRRAAERLTLEVGQLLREQRSIAETLQHALLPQELPVVPGLDIATRYIPGVNGVDIGGDWYDVISLGEGRVFFTVGDVSGRGVLAGSVMASLHFAIRGFVSEGHGPGAVLDRLAALLDLSRDGHFATVLCGVAEPGQGELTLANAGHLPPLLDDPSGSRFVTTEVGPPIGVHTDSPYREVHVPLPRASTLFAYTDGLVERRGESIDDGLQRLQAAAMGASGPIQDVLGTVVSVLAASGTGGFDDDTAILGVRWQG